MLKELLYFSDLPPLFILVIMEDTLRVVTPYQSTRRVSLNPCFNGRYPQSQCVIMCVLFTLRLNPCFNGRYPQRR